MDKFKQTLANFMAGRYGGDQLNQKLSTWVIFLIIISMVLQLLGRHFSGALPYVGRIVNYVAFAMVIVVLFRSLSRNIPARSAENEWFLNRKNKSGKKKQGRASNTRANTASAAPKSEFKYLKCPFCEQEMRVPRGKGKIAVKCPKCGEKTIINS